MECNVVDIMVPDFDQNSRGDVRSEEQGSNNIAKGQFHLHQI